MIQHLACIMDGNRRWAKKRGLMPWYGHKEGAEAVRLVIRFCMQQGISYLSLYTFSLENFNRSAQEKEYIFSFLVHESHKELPQFIENGIKITFIGDRSQFPASVVDTCHQIEDATAHGTRLTVMVLFCYGSRQEIVHASKKIAQEVASGSLSIDAITPQLISRYLWTGSIPDPDLVIRTGGLQRLSNFLLFQVAYSELFFLDLENALSYFAACKRNFGK